MSIRNDRQRRHKQTKKEAAAREVEIEAARDAGRGWFESHADAPLAAISREASRMYDCDGQGKAHVVAFVEGFQQARQRRDEYLREQAH